MAVSYTKNQYFLILRTVCGGLWLWLVVTKMGFPPFSSEIVAVVEGGLVEL